MIFNQFFTYFREACLLFKYSSVWCSCRASREEPSNHAPTTLRRILNIHFRNINLHFKAITVYIIQQTTFLVSKESRIMWLTYCLHDPLPFQDIAKNWEDLVNKIWVQRNIAGNRWVMSRVWHNFACYGNIFKITINLKRYLTYSRLLFAVTLDTDSSRFFL